MVAQHANVAQDWECKACHHLATSRTAQTARGSHSITILLYALEPAASPTLARR